MLESVIFEQIKEALFPFEDEVVLLEKANRLGFVSLGFTKKKNGATFVVLSNMNQDQNLIPTLGVVYNDITKKMIVVPNVAAFNSEFPRLMLITDDESFYRQNPEISHALDLLYGTAINIFLVYTHFSKVQAEKELGGILGFNESHMRNPVLFYLLKSYKTYSKINAKKTRSHLILVSLLNLLMNVLGNKKSILSLKAREDLSLQNGFFDMILFTSLFSFEKGNRQRFYSILENQYSVFVGIFFVAYAVERTHYNLNEYMTYFEENIKPHFKQRLISLLDSYEDKELEEFSSKAKSLFHLVKKRGEAPEDFMIRVREGISITKSKISDLNDDSLLSANRYLEKSIKESREERAERLAKEPKVDRDMEEEIPF